ncbi:MAG: hypothetical protein H6711_06550 [Myxococcales bacterium]|nr:hypothetical protein [Myxococcales bacterium]
MPAAARLLAVLALVAPALAACTPKGGVVEASDDPRALLEDTAAVCTMIAGGDPHTWRDAAVRGTTWRMLIERARAGDPKATCDAAALIDRRWRETLTCTAAQAKALAGLGRCRLGH